jgi:hypothetical protein
MASCNKWRHGGRAELCVRWVLVLFRILLCRTSKELQLSRAMTEWNFKALSHMNRIEHNLLSTYKAILPHYYNLKQNQIKEISPLQPNIYLLIMFTCLNFWIYPIRILIKSKIEFNLSNPWKNSTSVRKHQKSRMQRNRGTFNTTEIKICTNTVRWTDGTKAKYFVLFKENIEK